MEDRKRSFLERLTGSIAMREDEPLETKPKFTVAHKSEKAEKRGTWIEEETDEAELALDIYQTPTHIMVQTMVAGVKPEDIELSISRDVISIRGKREDYRTVDENNYFAKELYWGRFSRTFSLPQEIEPEEVEATEKHGLLTIKLQKVDKDKKNTIRVKSL